MKQTSRKKSITPKLNSNLQYGSLTCLLEIAQELSISRYHSTVSGCKELWQFSRRRHQTCDCQALSTRTIFISVCLQKMISYASFVYRETWTEIVIVIGALALKCWPRTESLSEIDQYHTIPYHFLILTLLMICWYADRNSSYPSRKVKLNF